MIWSWASFLEDLLSPYMLAGAWTTVAHLRSMAVGVVLGCRACLIKMANGPVPLRQSPDLRLAVARHAAADPTGDHLHRPAAVRHPART